ncbi:MAG: hypothetical protein IPJ77_07400 [Planctomycetes bacterium]|nr:hypothetical protein [Planctomycetota bacterium]
MKNRIHLPSALAGALIVGLTFTTLSMQQTISAHRIPTLTPEQAAILSRMSIVQIPDGQGGSSETIRFTGVNVQIVNGLGATNGYPADPSTFDPALTSTNGVGNLIIGYNELGNPVGDDRTGSHTLIFGSQLSTSGFGGQVVGFRSRMSGAYASVSGGLNNFASGAFSAISGGSSGRASGLVASISGGNAGVASGQNASITGGQLNVASGLRTTVLGGGSNQALAEESVIVGGGHAFDLSEGNVSEGVRSVIVGGSANRTLVGGHTSVVGGGYGRTFRVGVHPRHGGFLGGHPTLDGRNRERRGMRPVA